MDLTRAIASRTDFCISDVLTIINALFREIIDRFKNGDRIELRGFGIFYVQKRKPRKFSDPQTGEIKYSKGSKQLKFKMSENLHTEGE